MQGYQFAVMSMTPWAMRNLNKTVVYKSLLVLDRSWAKKGKLSFFGGTEFLWEQADLPSGGKKRSHKKPNFNFGIYFLKNKMIFFVNFFVEKLPKMSNLNFFAGKKIGIFSKTKRLVCMGKNSKILRPDLEKLAKMTIFGPNYNFLIVLGPKGWNFKLCEENF